uniref:MAM domain-containing protein, meprin/A5/mu n=1 Tax=Candidatus Kentrum sp. FW TaxID=2126338 RepID=A0A450T843_9GAMM|nr:MAG: MAM domain-containing protein, meprin/A5/mu [Candidatus Kentron sp. FW]
MKVPVPFSRPFGPVFLLFLLGFCVPASLDAMEYTATFEAGLDGWTASKGTSLFNWTRRGGSTHSGHTGPASAREGDYYLYLEASRNTPATRYLAHPCHPPRRSVFNSTESTEVITSLRMPDDRIG